MSAPFLRFGALFKDNAFFNDTLKLKILNDRKRVGTSGTLVTLVPPAGNRTTASVCDQSEGMRSNRRSPKGKVFWVKNIFFTIKIPLQFKIFDFKVFWVKNMFFTIKQTSFVRSAPLVALRGAPVALRGKRSFSGPVAERFKAVVLKTIIANTITSSNLVLPFLVIECFSLCSASTQ